MGFGSGGIPLTLSQYTLIDADGVSAKIEALDPEHATVKLNDGRLVAVPRTALSRQTDQSFRVSFSLTRFLSDGVMVIPVVEEQVEVEKRTTEHTVRINKSVNTRDATVDEELLREQVEIERIPVNRYVDAAPQIREENGVTVIPLVEEVLVVEKRLLLREEIHVTRRQSAEKFHEVYTLHSEEVHIERDGDINPL